jgi:Phosphoesterase family
MLLIPVLPLHAGLQRKCHSSMYCHAPSGPCSSFTREKMSSVACVQLMRHGRVGLSIVMSPENTMRLSTQPSEERSIPYALVILWDESGGWYDHVPPPQLPNAMGLGARGPSSSSPYAKPGTISHQQMDFVPILRFIQWNWGLGMFTDPIQAAREQQTGDLCDLLKTPCSSP